MSFLREFRVGLGIGMRIDDHRLERPAEQSAARVLLLDQHDQEFLQRPLARRHGAGQRMQDADLDRAEFEVGEIARHRVDQPLRAAEQIFGGGHHAVAGLLDARGDGRNLRQHAGHRAGDLLGAIADAIDLCGLVIEDAGELPVGVAHRRDARRDAGDGFDRLVHGVLDVMNLGADFAGGLGGLLRQRFDLGSDDGEAAAGGAGARRFDRGVERQQRGLRGDRLDQLDHGADAFGGGGEAADGEVGMAEIGDGAVGRVLGGGGFGRASARSAPAMPRAASATAADVAAGDGGGIDGLRRAPRHVLVAGAEIGGGDADFLAGGLECDGELVDGAAKALGEEAAAGMAQPRFGLAAAMIDRERIGIDQRLPHGFGGGRAVGERAAADPLRQRGIAVAAGDLGDGADHAAQRPLALPRRRKRADQRRGKSEQEAARCPRWSATATAPAKTSGSTIQAGSGFLQIGGHFGGNFSCGRKFLENMSEIAHIRLPKPFLMLHCSA